MKFAIAIALYLCAAFLTGGYYSNHRCVAYYSCGIRAVYAGAIWPVYWASRGAIEVTR